MIDIASWWRSEEKEHPVSQLEVATGEKVRGRLRPEDGIKKENGPAGMTNDEFRKLIQAQLARSIDRPGSEARPRLPAMMTSKGFLTHYRPSSTTKPPGEPTASELEELKAWPKRSRPVDERIARAHISCRVPPGFPKPTRMRR